MPARPERAHHKGHIHLLYVSLHSNTRARHILTCSPVTRFRDVYRLRTHRIHVDLTFPLPYLSGQVPVVTFLRDQLLSRVDTFYVSFHENFVQNLIAQFFLFTYGALYLVIKKYIYILQLNYLQVFSYLKFKFLNVFHLKIDLLKLKENSKKLCFKYYKYYK